MSDDHVEDAVAAGDYERAALLCARNAEGREDVSSVGRELMLIEVTFAQTWALLAVARELRLLREGRAAS